MAVSSFSRKISFIIALSKEKGKNSGIEFPLKSLFAKVSAYFSKYMKTRMNEEK